MATNSGGARIDRPSRCLIRIPVTVRSAGALEPLFAHAVSGNLSPTGIYLRGVLAAPSAGHPMEVGAHLSLSFVLPGEEEALAADAEVVWLNPQERDLSGAAALGVGAKFTTPSRALDEALTRFVRTFQYQVLIVDDEAVVRQVVRHALEQDFRVLEAESGAQALTMLSAVDVAVLIVDQRMPGMTGLDLLKELARRFPALPTVRLVMSAYAEPEVIRDFVNHGKIFHYLVKPVDVMDLRQIVARAVDHFALTMENERLNTELLKANARLKRENWELREQVGRAEVHAQLVGRGKAFRDAVDRIEQVAQLAVPVHLHGETGTGKELLANTLHRRSRRRDAPFLAVNCAGMPDTLVQSILFGHRKGAFTGATTDRMGLFEEAHGGTLLLDEVGDLSPTAQTSLLRVLQEGEVLPLGETHPRRVDVRIVSATHRDLRADVPTGRFREDLYYRLVVFEIRLPPLRERPEDIPLLVEHFLRRAESQLNKRVKGADAQSLATLEAYPWPGNVRELNNEVLQAAIRAPEGEVITVEHLSPRVRGLSGGPAAPGNGRGLDEAVRQVETRMILEALAASNHVVATAARLLDVEPSTLRKKIRRLGLRAER